MRPFLRRKGGKRFLAKLAVAWRRKPPLCKGRWHGAAVTEGLSVDTMTWFYLSFPTEPVCSRLAAGRRFCRVQSQYAYPAGAYFCSCKSRQNTLGAVPQGPLTLKLRLDTNDALASSVQRRRYALKVPAAHFILAPAGTELKLTPYKRRLAPDPGGCRPSGRGKWGPRKVARPCGERRMHCSGEGCPKQSIGSARLKRRLRPMSVGSLGRSPK